MHADDGHTVDGHAEAGHAVVRHAVVRHLCTAELEAGLDDIRQSPADGGMVELIVSRPAVDQREVLDEAWLQAGAGLSGDTWGARRSSRTADGSPHPDMALTLMNARSALLVADDPGRRMLAGDQLYVDLDIGVANLPPGTRLAVGSAVIEVTDQPHLGCEKFGARFGEDAWKFVNSRVGRELRLRGANTRVVSSGTVRTSDRIRKLP
jgi:MOSC domain-containing protein YiiM